MIGMIGLVRDLAEVTIHSTGPSILFTFMGMCLVVDFV